MSIHNKEDLEKLRHLTEGIDFAMLTTLSEEGLMHSRPMSTLELDVEEGALWFFTNDPSPKTTELNANPECNVAYSHKGKTFVSIAGRASVVHDRAKAAELWNETHRVWFPNGTEDPSLGLIKVEIEQAQYWETPGAVASALSFAKAYVSGEIMDSGEVKKISFR